MAVDRGDPRAQRQAFWRNTWTHRGALARLLWPLHLLHRVLWALRGALYGWGLRRAQRLPIPVIVVGNAIAGGAGKTPTVIALVHHLKRQGWRPGVVSRGYGRSGPDGAEVRADSVASAVGDEPLLIHGQTGVPVVVHRQRVLAGRQLMQQHPEVNVLVCDDGLQHWRLARDIDVVVFDERGIGNGWLLPAGLLRQPWPSGSPHHAVRFVLHPPEGAGAQAIGSSEPNRFAVTRRLANHAVDLDGTTGPLLATPTINNGAIEGLGALAGIAQPERFFDMLEAQGLSLAVKHALPDHADAESIRRAMEQHGPHLRWLCTEKDWVKLRGGSVEQRQGLDIRAVPLVQDIDPGFWAALDRALKALSSPHGSETA